MFRKDQGKLVDQPTKKPMAKINWMAGATFIIGSAVLEAVRIALDIGLVGGIPFVGSMLTMILPTVLPYLVGYLKRNRPQP